MTVPSRPAAMLAVGSTATALSLSILAGWQRGGSLPEQAVWVAIGIVLVVSAHLLPALIRDAPIPVRSLGSLLWVACLATVCYGHVVFFLLAQQHAGARRASTEMASGIAESGRNLTIVMSEQATLTRQLAFARAQRCARDCPTLEARRMTLAAQLDALDAERDDIGRRLSADDRATERRDALLADPVTSRLAALLGTTVARIDLLSGIAFAAVLEGVSCLLWTLALRPPPVGAPAPAVNSPLAAKVTDVTHVDQAAVTPNTSGHAASSVSLEIVTGSPADGPVVPSPGTAPDDDDVTKLALEVTAGRVRPTVASIRRHLGCSQSRAAGLRRQLAERNVTA